MERKELINEIAVFCYDYRLFKRTIKIDELINIIELQLEDVAFIESLINTIIVKTNKDKNIDVEKVKKILLELDKIRLELEYKDSKNKNIE